MTRQIDGQDCDDRVGISFCRCLVSLVVMGGVQAESIALESVRRGVVALSDLETVAALKQSLAS